MKISIIVATDDKNGIGKDNALMWHIPEELKHFKEVTTGHPIIMGRITHQSIGKALPNRTNIVITRDQEFKSEGCQVVNSLEGAIKLAKESEGSGEIFIIGGGEIYTQVLENNLVDKIYLTKVKGDFKASVFFPDYKNFEVISKSSWMESREQKYQFLELEKS